MKRLDLVMENCHGIQMALGADVLNCLTAEWFHRGD